MVIRDQYAALSMIPGSQPHSGQSLDSLFGGASLSTAELAVTTRVVPNPCSRSWSRMVRPTRRGDRPMKWSPLIISMAALPVVVLVPLRSAFAFDCTGTAVSNSGGTLSLICSGTCTTGSCAAQTGTDAQGEFTYCGCNPGDTDSCCTVVLRKISGIWTPSKYGSCPACPAAGSCKLCGSDYEPVCGQCPTN